jgi:hypothetical protein
MSIVGRIGVIDLFERTHRGHGRHAVGRGIADAAQRPLVSGANRVTENAALGSKQCPHVGPIEVAAHDVRFDACKIGRFDLAARSPGHRVFRTP